MCFHVAYPKAIERSINIMLCVYSKEGNPSFWSKRANWPPGGNSQLLESVRWHNKPLEDETTGDWSILKINRLFVVVSSYQPHISTSICLHKLLMLMPIVVFRPFLAPIDYSAWPLLYGLLRRGFGFFEYKCICMSWFDPFWVSSGWMSILYLNVDGWTCK
jgi:hypothetical protein